VAVASRNSGAGLERRSDRSLACRARYRRIIAGNRAACERFRRRLPRLWIGMWTSHRLTITSPTEVNNATFL
jgi:hypothetical protein